MGIVPWLVESTRNALLKFLKEAMLSSSRLRSLKTRQPNNSDNRAFEQ